MLKAFNIQSNQIIISRLFTTQLSPLDPILDSAAVKPPSESLPKLNKAKKSSAPWNSSRSVFTFRQFTKSTQCLNIFTLLIHPSVAGVWPGPQDNWKWKIQQERREVKIFRCKNLGSKANSCYCWSCRWFGMARASGFGMAREERGEHSAATSTCSSLPSSQVITSINHWLFALIWTKNCRPDKKYFCRKVSQVWDDDHEVQELYRYTSFDRCAVIPEKPCTTIMLI